MAQVSYRGNLSASEYPLLPEQMGASVIVAGYDHTLSRYVDSNESRDSSIGIPQVYFAENVLPTKGGLSSIQFRYVRDESDIGDPSVYLWGHFDVPIYGTDGGMYAGQLYTDSELSTDVFPQLVVYTPATDTVVVTRKFVEFPGTPVRELGWTKAASIIQPISSAYVQGRQYVCVRGMGVYLVRVSADAIMLDQVELLGLDALELEGIVGANGYLLAYTKNSVAWSTTLGLTPDEVVRETDYAVGELVLVTTAEGQNRQYKCTTAGTTAVTIPTYTNTVGDTTTDGTAVFTCEALSVDFVPSLTTGAGGGIVEEVKGTIVCAKRTISGFILYTDQNMVTAVFTNNATYPYNFRELPNSAGIAHQACVTQSAEAGWHYALTESGLMQVASTGVKLIHPAVHDWLQAGRSGTVEFVLGVPVMGVDSASYTNYRLAYLRNRYLVISRGAQVLGIPRYYEALVYDTAMDRFGGLRIDHNMPVDMQEPQAGSTDLSRGMFFIDNTGYVAEVRASVPVAWVGIEDSAAELGTIVLGRYRHSRGQILELHEVKLSNVYADLNSSSTAVCPYVTLNEGSTVVGKPPMYRAAAPSATNLYRGHYKGRVVGTDVSLVITAPFALNSVELVFKTGGHR